MDNNEYLINLRRNMIKNKCDENHIINCEKYAKELLKKGFPVIFDAKHLELILKMGDMRQGKQAYNHFHIYGKYKIRNIIAPSKKLKIRQQWILHNILEKVQIHNCCHGFVKSKSIFTNAKMHCDKSEVLTLDIRSFFESISRQQVLEEFKNMGYTISAATKLTDICCYGQYLPQGAPTSPYLANIVFKKLDEEINFLTQKNQITYTRYADDLSFSGDNNIFHIKMTIINLLKKIVLMLMKKKLRSF